MLIWGLELFREPFALFGVLVGGNTNNSTNAGAFYFNVNNNLTNTNVNIGFRLSLIYISTPNP